MANISIKNMAYAIYESSRNKDGAPLDAIIKNSVDLISRKHLLSKSKEILKQLEIIFDKNEGVVRAQISSNKKIDKKITDEIEDFIKKRHKVKNVILEYKIDPKLLGGIRIEIGDEIIDTTLKHKIRKLENYLITQ